jgi:hypothetical protein
VRKSLDTTQLIDLKRKKKRKRKKKKCRQITRGRVI